MYAEERQQAMARSISQDGRLSVAQLAETFDVTTETVRRDLSSLERIGLVRRVHGGAVPASSLSVIESGIGERDQANTAAKDAIAEAALQQLPPPGLGRHPRCRVDHRPVGGDPPPRPPADRRHPRGAGRGPARRPATHRAPPAAGPGPAHDPRRGRPRHRRRAPATCAPTWRSWRPTASAPTSGSPPPTATRPPPSVRSWAPPGVRSCSPTPPRSASRPRGGSRRSATSTSSSPTADRRRRPPRPREGRAGGRRRMIITLTANPSHDRTVALPEPLQRGAVQRADVGHLAGRRQGGQHLPRLGRRPACPTLAVLPAPKDDPFVLELLVGRHRLPPGRPRRATCGSTSPSASPTAPPPSSTARARR